MMFLTIFIAFLVGVILCYVYFWVTLIHPSSYGVYYIEVNDSGEKHVWINLSNQSILMENADSVILYRTDNKSDVM